jgi:uncharacterized protein YkwD
MPMRHTMMTFCALALGGCAVTASVDGSEGVVEEPEGGEVGDSAEEDESALGTIALTINEGLDAEERIFLQKLNEYRAANGLAPLQVSVALTKACEFHSDDMAAKNYFSHDSQDGTSWSTRIKRYYNYPTYMAENIAAGNSGGEATFTQWKNSPGHDANMKGTNYRVIGIARAYSATSTYKWYWTTDFGGYVDEVMTDGGTPPPPPPPTTPTSLLSNGTFDADELTAGVTYTSIRTTGRWHWAAQAGTATMTAEAAAASARGLRVVDALSGSISVGQLVAATAGKTYAFSAKVRRVSGGSAQAVYLDFLNASYSRIGRSTITPGTSTTFHDVTRNVVAPTGTAFVRVTIYGYQGSNNYASTYDWDEVTLTAQ